MIQSDIPTLLAVMWQDASGRLAGGTGLPEVATSANLDSGLCLLCTFSVAAGLTWVGTAS